MRRANSLAEGTLFALYGESGVSDGGVEPMSETIAVFCCNLLFGEGIKRILNDTPEWNAVLCRHANELADVEPKLVIADSRSVAWISLDELFDNGTMLLLLELFGEGKINEERVLSFIPRGLVGILSPESDIASLNKAIRSVYSGELWIERKKLKDILADGNHKERDLVVLTEKEKIIVDMICKGCRNKDIVDSLKISEQAVKSHLHRIFRKVGVSDRLQLALHFMDDNPRD